MVIDKLQSVKKFYRKYRRLPSYSEMLKLFGFSSKNAVFKIVQKWMDEGLIKKINNKLAPTSKFFSLPFLGIIKAGFPILAEEDKNYLTLDEYLIEDPQSAFLLKVSGDSLSGIGIFEGDIVIIERKRQAITGDVVLAQIDKEWTLKILKKDRIKQLSYLEAANPKYPAFYPKQELQIFGVVKAVVRKFN
ncbi:MAG: polymerase V subunit protein [Candidatus Roizmanbacteria bacterium GW2011_GWA2_36_23]|uniref:Polymerase V subunit protein n=1 Tax=Candidatus Roizmanbacteria bacterium GW2011_GWA2_36_23 TaxID=1618480 RepID=A0A0G0E7Z0_9BACT|nr:MAG: polymerase V subunit protein [Candidatus Roizmanbacteria bacterium GW2011_GWA2_36_23]